MNFIITEGCSITLITCHYTNFCLTQTHLINISNRRMSTINRRLYPWYSNAYYTHNVFFMPSVLEEHTRLVPWLLLFFVIGRRSYAKSPTVICDDSNTTTMNSFWLMLLSI